MIRKFRLINRDGAAYDLNSKQSFFHKVGGLGFKDDTQFQKIGTDFYALEEKFSQGEITGMAPSTIMRLGVADRGE